MEERMEPAIKQQIADLQREIADLQRENADLKQSLEQSLEVG